MAWSVALKYLSAALPHLAPDCKFGLWPEVALVKSLRNQETHQQSMSFVWPASNICVALCQTVTCLD